MHWLSVCVCGCSCIEESGSFWQRILVIKRLIRDDSKCPHLFDLSWWLGSANALPLDFWCIPVDVKKSDQHEVGWMRFWFFFYSYFRAEGDRICRYQGQNQSIMVVNEEKRMVFLHFVWLSLRVYLLFSFHQNRSKFWREEKFRWERRGERVEEEKWDFLVYKVVDFRSEGWTHTLKVSVHLAKW